MKSDAQLGSTPSGGEVLLYEAPDCQVRVEGRFERETVCLSLPQMTELVGRDKSMISRHLRTVFGSGELEREAVVAKNATTAADGKTYKVEFFNLDAILICWLSRQLQAGPVVVSLS